MKAIGAMRCLPVDDPECLVDFDAERPQPGARDVLVKVEAVSVNPVDTKVRMSLKDMQSPPRVLGWDAAGVVVETGASVTRFKPGDRVMCSGDVAKQGCNAEFFATDERIAGRMPKCMTFAEAAALPLASLTAWELLFDRMTVDPEGSDEGKEILVIGGGGGVGSVLIQLARSAGLMVIATASRPESQAWCLEMGARHVINHREPLRPQLEALGVRHVPYLANLADTGGYWDVMADLIAPLGDIGLIVEPKEKVHVGDPLKLKCARICWEFMAAKARFQTQDFGMQGMILNMLADMVEEGRLRGTMTETTGPICARNIIGAHALMESGMAVGKRVLEGWG